MMAFEASCYACAHYYRQKAMEMEVQADGLISRSRTMLQLSPTADRKPRKLSTININIERLQQAKEQAEKAIKVSSGLL